MLEMRGISKTSGRSGRCGTCRWRCMPARFMRWWA